MNRLIKFVILLGAAIPVAALAQAVPIVVPDAAVAAFADGRDLFWAAAQLLGLLVPLVLLLTGWGARLSRRCERLARGNRWGQAALFAMAYALLVASVNLPLAYFEELHRRGFGRSTASTGEWLAGQASGTLLWVGIAALIGPLLFLLIRRSPRRWWLYGALVTVSAGALFFVVEPLTMAPQRLDAPELAGKLAALAKRAGVADLDIVLRDVNGLCASGALKGMGPTKRIVLDDAFVQHYSEREVLAVTGHELGHYAHHDDLRGLAVLALVALFVLGSSYWLASLALSRWQVRFGFDRLADPAALPLLLLGASIAWLAITPAFNAYARHVESEADRFTAELGFAREQAELMVKDSRCYRIAPESNWFRTMFRAGHPSINDRIRMLNGYR